MSETKHTPGPWEFIECGTANAIVRIHDECTVEGRYNGGQCDLLSHADARLIAAAPMLLKSLEALRDATREHATTMNSNGSEHLARAISNASAAIAATKAVAP